MLTTQEMDCRVYLVEHGSGYFQDEWEKEMRGGKTIH
jgi:hypothetical protein